MDEWIFRGVGSLKTVCPFKWTVPAYLSFNQLQLTCRWFTSTSAQSIQHIYLMHMLYVNTIYLLICTYVCVFLFWSIVALFYLVMQRNSYLLLTVYIRHSVSVVFFLSHSLTFYAISISLTSHGSYLRLLWACPGSASVTATVCLLSTTVAWRWQRGVWATSYVRQDKTPGALVCIRLFWDLPHCPLYLKFVCDLFVYLFKLLNLH